MNARADRRSFIKAAGAAGAGVWLGTAVESKGAEAANEKLNLAVVGVGGRGAQNLPAIDGQNIVALCDVDDQRAGKAYEKYPQARKFYDFRRMFDAMESQIDAVVISTPDHTHFHPTWWAMQRGKHVYLEKPLAHSVWEVRALTRLAAEKRLATQLGVQRHVLPGLRSAVEIVQAGTIGTVRECHAWIASSRGMPDSPAQPEKVPPHLKWDLWLGPAAERPYSAAFAPYNWRFWWDFGTGETGNWGCHILDIPFWALGLGHPLRVSGTGPSPDAAKTPTAMATQIEFAATAQRPAVTLHWYQGTPPKLAELGLSARGMNNLFIGSEGMLLCGFDKYQLLPADKYGDYRGPEPRLPKSPGFYEEWFRACKGGQPASCNFDYSGPMTETVLLANIAYRVQGGFDWDHASLRPVGNTAAENYVRTHFRKGWEV